MSLSNQAGQAKIWSSIHSDEIRDLLHIAMQPSRQSHNTIDEIHGKQFRRVHGEMLSDSKFYI
jgi:hypothetical protein